MAFSAKTISRRLQTLSTSCGTATAVSSCPLMVFQFYAVRSYQMHMSQCRLHFFSLSLPAVGSSTTPNEMIVPAAALSAASRADDDSWF